MSVPAETLSAAVPARNDLDVQMMGAELMRRLFGAEHEPAPLRIGRFFVTDRIGSGGMGTVLGAYDAQLGRRIAVKVLREDIARDVAAQRRLQREAQGLAKLSHPNVVTIHEVGTHEGQTFLAMEYADGGDLAQWLRAHPIGDPARLATGLLLLAQAGRGLAAAHAAGLVHRDFKPSNVLISTDAPVGGDPARDSGTPRARVADFGLVRLSREPQDASLSPESATIASPDGESHVTKLGTVVGTLAYMAPEQRRGAVVDAKSDQFSFCVTAWELVFGALPWHGDAIDEHPRIPGHGPRWIGEVLRRGLEPDPSARYDGMDALLAALGRDPSRRRRWIAAGIAVVAVATATSLAWAHRRARMCDDGPAALEATWNDTRRDALAQRFAALGIRGATDAWERSDVRITAFATEWLDARDGVCDAGRRKGELAPETFAAAMGCLDVELVDLEATLSVLERGSPPVASAAMAVVFGLPSPAACARGDVAQAMTLPSDPERAAEVLDVARGLAEARLFAEAEDGAEAVALLDALEPEVARLDHLPLSLRLASVRWIATKTSGGQDRIDDAEATYWTALRTGHDAVASTFARRLAVVEAERSDLAAAQQWIDHARVLADRARVDEAERVRLEVDVTRIALALGDRQGGLRTAESAVARAEAVWGKASPELNTPLQALANAQMAQGDAEASARTCRRALELREEALGPDDLGVAVAMGNLAVALIPLGEYDEAIALVRRCADIHALWRGENAVATLGALTRLGTTLARADRPAEAVEVFRRILPPLVEQLPPEDLLVQRTRHNFVNALVDAGELDEALELARVNVEIYERVYGRDDWQVAMPMWGLGRALWRRGDLDAASTALERSATLFDGAPNGPPPDAKRVREELAEVMTARDARTATAADRR